jgi:ankyrin repeat protein
MGDDYQLYEVFFDTHSKIPPWSIKTGRDSPEMVKKLKQLRDYFIQRYYNKTLRGEWQLIGTNGHYLEDFNKNTFSILLGLFLAALKKIQNRKFRTGWDTVTVTGVLDYNEDSGEIMPVNVKKEDIDKKYGAVKNYAKNHKGRHLFIYILDKAIIEDASGNIEVKHFTTEISIFDIMDSVFELYIPGMENPDLDDTQRKLLNNMNNMNKMNGRRLCQYIPTTEFQENQQKIFSKDWRGFFIHGEGESGKSAMAEAMARYMVWCGKIYAPLWIKIVDNDRLDEFGINEYRLDEIGKLIGAQTNTADYFANSILKQLGKDPNNAAELENIFSERQYLIIFDNIETDSDTLNALMEKIDTFINKFYNNTPFVLITSRNYSDTLNLNNLKEIEAPVLDQEQIKILIYNLAKQYGFLDKIKAIEGTEKYTQLITEIKKNLGSSPGMIIPVVKRLRKLSADEALSSLQNFKNLGERVIGIFKTSFQNLSEKEKSVLFMMLDCGLMGPDIPADKDILYNHWLKQYSPVASRKITYEEIDTALETLEYYNFIYSRGESGEYAIKTHHFLAFTFAHEFAGELYMREHVMTNYPWKLYIALRYDRESRIVESILKKLEKDDIKMNHLCIAGEYSSNISNLELLKARLEGRIDMENENGVTAFMYVSRFSPKKAIIQWFVENLRKLDENVIFKKDKQGYDAFCCALKNPNLAICQYLVENGADVNTRDNTGSTPLHANVDNLRICQFLVENGADINARNNFGATPLQYAVQYTDNPVCQYLVEKGADVNAGDNDGMTPLHNAAFSLEVSQYLVENGADINARDNTGSTPLHSAAQFLDYPEVCQYLVKKGADINVKNNKGYTPLHFAVLYSDIPKVRQYLVNNGADVNVKDNEGYTPLHFAVRNNYIPEDCQCLVKIGADVNAGDNNGKTPLHLAVTENQNPKIYQYLVNNGADVNVKDNDGYTPLHYAIQSDLKDRVSWLKQHGAKSDNP